MWRAFVALLLGGLLLAAARAADPPGADWNYRIARGDTLIGISAEWLERPDDWPKLQKLNRITNPRRLPPGGTLRIPFALLKKGAQVARVIFVRGRVTVARQGAAPGAAERPLALGDGIGARDVIRTDAQASVSLRFADGSRLLIGPGSQVNVVRMLEIGRSALPDAVLDIQRGDAEVHIVPNAGRRFELRTPAMNLGVRGTSFRARVDAGGRAAGVEVLDGRVAAAAGADEVQIGAGFGVLSVAGEPIRPPRPLLAAPSLVDGRSPWSALPVRVAWQPLAGAVGYRVQVLADAADERLLLDGRVDAPAAQWADLPDGRYRLRVRGIDAAGLEGLDAQVPLVVKARPFAPAPRLPAPDSSVIGPSVPFEWAAAEGAVRYRLQVARDADFRDLVVDDASLTTTRRAVDLPAGRYHWRLGSIAAGRDGADDAGPPGPPQAVEVRQIPPPLPLDEPANAPGGVQLRWPAPPAGHAVRLQIAEDPDFRRLAVDRTLTGSDATAFLAELGPGRYHVRARLVAPDGTTGPYGPARTFDIGLPPISPWWVLPFGWLLL